MFNPVSSVAKRIRSWLMPRKCRTIRRQPHARLQVELLEDRAVPATFSVTSAADVGLGSLRQAILDANSSVGADAIEFNIGGGGPQSIALQTALPDITESVMIDGWSQVGFVDVPLIELDGSDAGTANGLTITGPDVTIRGLVINSFSGHGISVYGLAASNASIYGNYIGTSADGTADLGNGGDGIRIDFSSSATIGGATEASRNVISGNGGSGVFVGNGGVASGTVIQGNYIGTDASGTAAIGNGTGIFLYGTVGTVIDGNVVSGNLGTGMSLNQFSGATVHGNMVGTNAAGTLALGNLTTGIGINGNEAFNNTISGNTIAANGASGLLVFVSAHDNVVAGNFIGTNAAGDAGLGNSSHGIHILLAPNNTIGGTTAGARNIISGNGGNGIHIDDLFSFGTVIQGNYIGISPDGTADLGNANYGILVHLAANTTIGGTTEAARNVISGNGDWGVDIEVDSGTTGTVIQGNYIGTDATGTAAIGNNRGIFMYGSVGTIIADNVVSGNTGSGMELSLLSNAVIQGNRVGTNAAETSALVNLGNGIFFGGANSTIGGTASGEGNIIAGNGGIGGYGLGLGGFAHDNVVQGNFIGTNADGASLGNGIGLLLHVGVTNNTIGGTASGAANVIAHNVRAGVAIIEEAGTGNRIQGNAIFDNGNLYGDLGIDLIFDFGVTPNDLGDADTGPNNLQNFPVFASSEPGATTHVVGSINSTPNSTFTLDFYASTSAHTSGYGEGERYLGGITVTTDGSGNASFNAYLAATTATGEFITATATDPAGSTSEFSAWVVNVNAPNAAPVITSLSNSSPDCGCAGAGQAVTIAASFTDAKPGDTHTATINWGDGTSSAGAVTESSGSGTVAGSHVYATGGIFTITVTVSDGLAADTETTTTIVSSVRLTPSGQLQIIGTNHRDIIHVQRHGDTIRAHFKSNPNACDDYDDEDDDDHDNVHSSHQRFDFDAGDVTSIYILACGGNDHVKVGTRIAVPAYIDGGAGDDHLRGGAGNDTIVDTSGNNRIHAGQGNDTVTTGGGDDRIWTDGGNDTIDAGNGCNDVHAGNGDNTITTGSGNDVIWSGSGNDVINAGNGHNDVHSGAGNDTVTTGSGRDVIHAGSGDDFVWAGAGCDDVQGGDGNDVVIGGSGDDLLIGGDGRDLLIGGTGADRIVGNASEDILIAGTICYDGNAAVLAAIMAEWSTGGSYATRVANIQAGTGLANGYCLVGDDGATQTVFNDNDADTLTGSQGSDWFFANRVADNSGVLDCVTDKAANELWSDTDF